MYEFIKKTALKIFKVPPEPDDPMGDVESLVVFRASPNFFKYKLIIWVFKSIIGGIVYIVVTGGILAEILPKLNKILFIIVVIGVFLFVLFYILQLFISYVIMRLDYEMRWYKVSDRSLRIREGIIFVREMTLTFANIQNISISQGPIQRFFKISDLRVETAGGGGGQAASQNQQNNFSMHVGFFRGVDNCEDIKDLMMKRLKKIKSTGLGDNDDNETETFCESMASSDTSSIITALKRMKKEAVGIRTAAYALKNY